MVKASGKVVRSSVNRIICSSNIAALFQGGVHRVVFGAISGGVVGEPGGPGGLHLAGFFLF